MYSTGPRDEHKEPKGEKGRAKAVSDQWSDRGEGRGEGGAGRLPQNVKWCGMTEWVVRRLWGG